MKPWLVVLIGLGLAVAAGYVLLTSGPIGDAEPESDAAYGEIREESRDKMRDLLREADGRNR